jgi:hypothetical protein
VRLRLESRLALRRQAHESARCAPYADGDPFIVDRHRSAPEPNLAAATAALHASADGWLPSGAWQVMVAFTTSLFARGPEFEQRFEDRLGPLGEGLFSADNTTIARVIDQQRLFAAVMYADWIAMRARGYSMITNDLGYLLTPGFKRFEVRLLRSVENRPPRRAVRVSGRTNIDVAKWRMGSRHPSASAHHSSCARAEPPRGQQRTQRDPRGQSEIVEHARAGFDGEQRPHGWGPDLLIPSSKALRDHEMDYMRMLGAISNPPPEGVTQWLMGWSPGTDWSRYENLIASMSM